MLKSILKTNEALSNALYEDNHFSYVLNSTELDCIQEACVILEYFDQITIRISGENYATSSIIIPSILLLLNVTDNDDNEDESEFKKTFKALINNKIKYYNQKYQVLNNNHLAVASFTNPFYKRFTKGIDDERKDLIERASKCIEEYYQANTEKFKISPCNINPSNTNGDRSKKLISLSDDSDDERKGKQMNVNRVRKEIKNYINSPKPDNNSTAVDFWKFNKEKYPIIFELFKQHHFLPGSTTASEREFSNAGEQIWNRRKLQE